MRVQRSVIYPAKQNELASLNLIFVSYKNSSEAAGTIVAIQ